MIFFISFIVAIICYFCYWLGYRRAKKDYVIVEDKDRYG